MCDLPVDNKDLATGWPTLWTTSPLRLVGDSGHFQGMIDANSQVEGNGTERSSPEPEPAGHTLGPEDVAEFQQLLAEETGVALPDEDARTRATELIELVRMLHGRIPEDR